MWIPRNYYLFQYVLTLATMLLKEKASKQASKQASKRNEPQLTFNSGKIAFEQPSPEVTSRADVLWSPYILPFPETGHSQ